MKYNIGDLVVSDFSKTPGLIIKVYHDEECEILWSTGTKDWYFEHEMDDFINRQTLYYFPVNK